MAKKAGTSKKAAAKKTSSSAGAKRTAKKTTKKAAASKKAASRAPASKTAAKKAAKKAATKAAKTTAKKTAGNASSKTRAKPAAAKKTQAASKKPASKKTTKKASPKKVEPKTDAPALPPTAGDTSAKNSAKNDAAGAAADTAESQRDADSKKPARKGITIVSRKPTRKSKPAKKPVVFPPTGAKLLGPGAPERKPLIPSGPSRPRQDEDAADSEGRPKKSPLSKAKLEKFERLLLDKRAELLGDVNSMESEALMSESGALSSVPQHLADQGSESFDRSLSLNLAEKDKRLIREIDAALARIRDGTYGICEVTGRPIKEARLQELPWTRLSIDAARKLEERGPLP